MEVNPTEPSPSVRVPWAGVSQAVVNLCILLKAANTCGLYYKHILTIVSDDRK
jgi:hypothetical protein